MKILLNDDLALQKLPEAKATYYFTDGKNVIFAGLTSNLYGRINKLYEQRKGDEKIGELWNKATDLIFDIRLSNIDSLVWYKSLLKSFTPYYNDYINVWESYTYLAIDWKHAPYLSIKENTQGDHLYLGPFRSRFFISDILSILNKYIMLPICPENYETCSLRNSDSCLSTCTSGDLTKLNTLIHQYYLSTNNNLADLLKTKYEYYYNDLQFIKAEEINIETKLLLNYYKYLKFLNETKSLNQTLDVDNRTYFIEDGLLAEVSGKDSIDFRDINRKIPYRENELLAVNKNQLDERWIVFDFLEQMK